MSFLLLHQTLVVPRYFHCQILLCLDEELHPCLTLLQKGLLLQQEGLEFATRSKQNVQLKCPTILSSSAFNEHLWCFKCFPKTVLGSFIYFFNIYHMFHMSYLNLSVVCDEAVDQLLLRFCMRLISESLRGSR